MLNAILKRRYLIINVLDLFQAELYHRMEVGKVFSIQVRKKKKIKYSPSDFILNDGYIWHYQASGCDI